MHDWLTREYRAAQQAEFERIRSKHPGLVKVSSDCFTGWFPIIEAYLDGVARLLAENPGSKFDLWQVKEKFAALRLYAGTSPDIGEGVKAAYDRAEAEAERTCEVCGMPGALRQRGYFYATRCDEHADGGELVPELEHAPEEITPWGSGNVYHDLGLPDPDQSWTCSACGTGFHDQQHPCPACGAETMVAVADEDVLRAALMAAILRGIQSCYPARVHALPDLTGLPEIILDEIVAGQTADRVALWPLMKAAAALGHDIRIGIRSGEGKVTVAVSNDDDGR